MAEPDVKLIIKGGGWGIKFLIKGQMVDFVDILEKAEAFDRIDDTSAGSQLNKLLENTKKLAAVKSWWDVFNQTIDSSEAKDRLAEVLGVEA